LSSLSFMTVSTAPCPSTDSETSCLPLWRNAPHSPPSPSPFHQKLDHYVGQRRQKALRRVGEMTREDREKAIERFARPLHGKVPVAPPPQNTSSSSKTHANPFFFSNANVSTVQGDVKDFGGMVLGNDQISLFRVWLVEWLHWVYSFFSSV